MAARGEQNADKTQRRLLEGVRVVEVCEVAAGPFCAMLLADLGADVIKIERPESGDAMRQWPPVRTDYSENFASINRNKRSIALDLKDEAMRETARSLMLSADAVVENYRPGIMAKYGLDHASLTAEKPSLVYCSISAYGQTGPRARQGGYDLTVQAIAGVMSVTGEPDGPPVKCGVPIADFVAGLYGALYVIAAIRKADACGHGHHIDVPMMATTLAVAALQTSEYFGTGKDPQRLGSAHPRNAPYRAFEARDGYFVMAAGNDRLWRAVTETIGRPDLYALPQFQTTALRAANQERLREILEEIFSAHTVGELVDAFTESGVPCGPINSYSQALQDPQIAHLGLVQDVGLPSGTQTTTVGSPIRVSRQAFEIRRPPPALDQHGAELREELAMYSSE